KSGEVTEERRVTQPKANHLMYDRMCRWDAEIIDLTRREAEADQAAVKKTCNSGVLREDYFSRRCLRFCRTLLRTARVLRGSGVPTPPAPPLDRRAIDQYVRAQTRELPKANQPINFLPPEWQAFAKLLQTDPKIYRDAQQAQPATEKASEKSPEPVVEKKESEIAEIATESTPVAQEEVSENVAMETGCVAGEGSETAAPESPIQRNNSDEPAVKKPIRVVDPFSAGLPPLRVTREIPGMFTTESRRRPQK
ncbi:MAG TPA: hypothetical protein VL096_01845, partial [Pirellulaceae bacterium]|nr:hypothetical protein [Pirellulaceae bacterium]